MGSRSGRVSRAGARGRGNQVFVTGEIKRFSGWRAASIDEVAPAAFGRNCIGRRGAGAMAIPRRRRLRLGGFMKLARYGRGGKEKPALVDGNGKLRDLSGVVADIDTDVLAPRALARLAKLKPESLPAVRGTPRIGPCLREVGNFIAVGLNYADHAAESGMPVPKEPVLFSKAPSCVVGPNDDVMTPKGSKKTDWEVELAIVIGTRASYVSESEALRH